VTEPVPLESIVACLQGAVPSPLATCSAEGVPNVTYVSIVQYVDSERVAVSRQFLNKTRANLDANPYAQVLVIEPGTHAQYVLDLRHLHTETAGETFETMRTNLDAVASQTGMGSVFRLRGVDIFSVTRCAPAGRLELHAGAPRPAHDVLEQLERYVSTLVPCVGYEDVTRVALEALDDLFGFRHGILLAADEASGRLFAVASTGYATSAVGAEVAPGDGIIGTAAARRRLTINANLARSRSMASAVGGADTDARDVPLPGLATARSAVAVPLVFGDDLLGVLYLESEHAAAFGGATERLLRILGGHLATALAARASTTDDLPVTPVRRLAAPAPDADGPVLKVVYYQADDTVLCDGEYVVKGVPGRILWRMLREHEASGREQFTNRELRLDEALGLPPGNDNLEARLLVLRRRLAERACGISLDRVGRGRLELGLQRPARLEEIPTSGTMRAVHQTP
jgi:hypothetical protein